MKLGPAFIAACLLVGLVAGCTYVLDGAARATPPTSSGLAIARPDRPAATPAAGPTICSLTPIDGTPCVEPQQGGAPGYPAPTDVPQVAAATGYPAPGSPGDLPPATVVIPTLTPAPAGPTEQAPATPTSAMQPTATAAASPTARTPAPTPSDPLDRAMLAAVRIAAPMGGASVASVVSEGLGVVLATEGRIVAPLHVLYDATSGALYDRDGVVQVQSFDASGLPLTTAKATLVSWDAGFDLAVLAIDGDGLAAATMGSATASALPVQAPLRLVLLAPQGDVAIRVMQTEVSGRYEDDGGPWIVAAANLSSGAIGGGVAFNAAGQIVGLLQAEGGLAPGQLVRIRPIDAVGPLLAAEASSQPLPAVLPVGGEERLLRILYRGAEGVNLRSGPSTQGSILASLHRDEVYPIVAPGESDGWFPVYAGGGRAGWVAQRHPTGTRLAEPETSPFRSALAEGGYAEVACLSAVPGRGCANLRAVPGWRAKAPDDVVAELVPGARVELLSGPRQADGLAWWQVREATNGTEGWIAEVTAGGYRALVAADAE